METTQMRMARFEWRVFWFHDPRTGTYPPADGHARLTATACEWDDETLTFSFACHDPIDTFAYVNLTAAQMLAADLIHDDSY